MYYPQSQTPNSPPHYVQASRPTPLDFNHPPRLHIPFPTEATSPLRPFAASPGFHGLQPLYLPSTHSTSEASSPYGAQQKKPHLQALTKNIAPDYVLPNLNRASPKATFNPSFEAITNQSKQLRMKQEDLSPKSRNLLGLHTDNEKNGHNELNYHRSPTNFPVDPSYGRPGGVGDFTSMLLKQNKKNIQGFDNGKLAVPRDEKLEDGDLSPRFDHQPFYMPQQAGKHIKLGIRNSPEKSLTIDTRIVEDGYIVASARNRPLPGISPYGDANNVKQPLTQRRHLPASFTSVFQSPSNHSGNYELQHSNSKLKLYSRNLDSKIEEENSVQNLRQGSHQEIMSPNSPKVNNLDRIIKRYATYAAGKQMKGELSEALTDRNETSIHQNLTNRHKNHYNQQAAQEAFENAERDLKEKRGIYQEEPEKVRSNIVIKKAEKKFESQKSISNVGKELNENREEGVKGPTKKNLKELFRKNTGELPEDENITRKTNRDITNLQVKASPMSPRSSKEKAEEKMESPIKHKSDSKIVLEEGKKNKEPKLFLSDLSDILERKYSENYSETTESDSPFKDERKQSTFNLNLANILNELDELETRSPRALKAKLTKKK